MKKLKKIVVLVVIAFVVMTVSRGVFRLISSRSKVEEARDKLAQVQKEQEELKAELEKVSSGYYKEEQLRDKLGLAKEGDIVIVLPSEDVLRRLSPRIFEMEEQNVSEPNWKKWAKLFF